MRALLIALALFHFSAICWAGEIIVAGDSDHTYLPAGHENELLLHKFSYNATVSSPATYGTWAASFNTNCVQVYNAQPSAGMDSANRACTYAENAFRAPRKFRLTRVVLRTGAAGTYAASSNTWAQTNIRAVTVSTGGTITEIGAETSFESGVGTMTTWNLDVDVSVGTGVSLQLRRLSSLALDDAASFPVIELWGTWK